MPKFFLAAAIIIFLGVGVYVIRNADTQQTEKATSCLQPGGSDLADKVNPYKARILVYVASEGIDEKAILAQLGPLYNEVKLLKWGYLSVPEGREDEFLEELQELYLFDCISRDLKR